MPPLDLPQVLPDLPPLTSHPLRENTIVPSVFPRKAEGADAIVSDNYYNSDKSVALKVLARSVVTKCNPP